MCSIVKTLDQLDQYRNITQCEHRTIYVNWYRSSLRLLEKELPGVVSFLEKTINEDLDYWSNETGMVEIDSRGHVMDRYHFTGIDYVID